MTETAARRFFLIFLSEKIKFRPTKRSWYLTEQLSYPVGGYDDDT